jgi:hypothetical protein
VEHVCAWTIPTGSLVGEGRRILLVDDGFSYKRAKPIIVIALQLEAGFLIEISAVKEDQ